MATKEISCNNSNIHLFWRTSWQWKVKKNKPSLPKPSEIVTVVIMTTEYLKQVVAVLSLSLSPAKQNQH